MTRFDIIGELRSQANSKGWIFTAGDDFYKSIDLANENIDAGDIVLTCMFNATPTIRNGRVVDVEYSGAISLGRKQDEDGTEATLDESYLDKYDSRLLELTTMLVTFIGQFACDNELEIVNMTLAQSINTFGSNIDFIGAEITISE